MSKFFRRFISLLLVLLLLGLMIFFTLTPLGVGMWNTWFYNVQKVDDRTSYVTRKKVEDSCRAMISSYTSDSLIYEQYKGSDNEEKQSWAEQAKMRANKTAASYNEYILKNSFVWEDNIPSDIKSSLNYIE